MSKKQEPFEEIETAEQQQSQSASAEPSAKVQEPINKSKGAAAPASSEPAGAEAPTGATPSPFSSVPDKQAAEYLAGWKRAQADYQNLRKSVEMERVNITKYANEGLLQDLVPVLAHFNMAFKSVSPDAKSAAWLKGFEYIANSFKQVLQQYGVTLIPTVGEQFSPEQHESVGEVASGEPEGTVVEEVSTGFFLHGKVMQAAKVKISTGKSK